jgi:hypothetical protein
MTANIHAKELHYMRYSGLKEEKERGQGRTLSPEQLLEAGGHQASWHHAPHAVRRLFRRPRLRLGRARSVGLLQRSKDA